MKQKIKLREGFTLVELMVVVIAVSIMAIFAIPSYTKAVERAYEKDAITNLTLIAGAQEAYKARYGDYWPAFTGACGGAACGMAGGLNTALGLNVVENGLTFTCADRGAGANYLCRATRTGGNNFIVYIDDTLPPNPPTSPCCDRPSGIACPTLATCP